jgi:hypothetical protein
LAIARKFDQRDLVAVLRGNPVTATLCRVLPGEVRARLTTIRYRPPERVEALYYSDRAHHCGGSIEPTKAYRAATDRAAAARGRSS